MHCTCIFFFFPVPYLWLWFCIFLLCLCLSWLVSLSWNLRNLFHLKTRFVVVLLLLFLLIQFGSVMRRHEMTSLRTFLTRWFIWNARSFCLTSQTFLYLVHLALGDGFLYVRNPLGVLMCSYRSFTPTCTLSIPLYLSLLWYSVVHVS